MIYTIQPFTETQVPAIPEPRPENMQQMLLALKEVVEVRNGLRGDPLDQNVTFRSLYGAGMLNTSVLTGQAMVRLPGAGLTFLPKSQVDEFAPPPAPTGLTVTGALANFILTWNAAQYHNHAYTEVWRSGSNDLGTAVRAGTTENALYADNIGDTAQLRYYWLRHVSMSGVPGPFNATAGTSDTTLQVLTNHIADFAVTNAKIGSLAVDSAKIADAAIVTAKIADAAITTAKIGAAQITTALILDAAITTAKIGAAQITTATIADLQVTTLKIEGNAVTIPTSAFTVTNVLFYNTAWVDLQSATYTSTGAQVFILISFQVNNPYSTDNSFQWELQKDGASYKAGLGQFVKGATSGMLYSNFSASFTDTPGSGSHTYNFRVIDEGANALIAGNRSMLLLEVKK